MGDNKVRVSAELYEKLRQLAERSGKSMRELVDEAIRAYLLGSTGIEGKEIKGITSKIIPLQYPARCRRCGKQLRPGELAYWVKITYVDNSVRSFIYCLDCYYQTSALKEYYLKKRQLEKVIRELKREADELADKVNSLRAEMDLHGTIQLVERAIREVYEALDIVVDPERREMIKQLVEKLEDIRTKLEHVDTVLSSSAVSVRRKRRARRWEYER